MHPLLSPRHWLFPLVLFGMVLTTHILWPGFSYEGFFDYIALSIVVLNTVLRVLSPRVVIGRIALFLQWIVTLLFMYLRFFFTDSGSCNGGVRLRFSFLHPLIPLARSLGIHQEFADVIFFVMYVVVMILEPIVVGVSIYDWYMWYTSRALPA